MASKLWAKIRLRRGLRENLPTTLNGGPLDSAEMGYCSDTGQLFIGSSSVAAHAPPAFFNSPYNGNIEICTVTPILTTYLQGLQSSSLSTILHTAANFALLAGASITSTGASVITGDVGAVSSITPGTPPWTVSGTVHTADDATTIQALADAQSAYNTLSVLPATTLTGDLGGQTLTSNNVTNGVYKYSSSAGLTGTLTLDFQNLSNQKIVIITGSTLTTASASVVHIINSNSTNQVFFVVGSSATLGVTTAFEGTIIALASITMNSTASILNGNAIALTGSVTMIDNTVTIPTAAVPTSFLTLPIEPVGSAAFIKYTLMQSSVIGTANFISSTSIPGVAGILGIDGDPTQALKTIQDITYTAVNPGVNGNNITIAYTTGAIAGHEVVTVVGDAISVQIQSGVSTAADIVTAITNSTGSSTLLSAASFAVLGATTITNTGATTINGNVGLYPGTSFTGSGTATISGTTHLTDSVAQQAQTDALAAFTYLNSQPTTTDLTGQDLGTVGTLTPGVYNFSSSAGLTGTLTLDFQGLSNQKIIFKIDSALTTASASAVHIINSNSTNQVFFVVGTSATLGTTTAFEGTIIAQSSITLTTGATITDGCAIALTGAVTMDSNTITVPPAVPAASALVTAVAITPGAFETAPVLATNLADGTGINITATETLAEIVTAINAANIPNIVAAAVYSGGSYHLQLTDMAGTVIQISPADYASSLGALLTALGLTSGAHEPVAVQIGTLSLIQNSPTTVLLTDTNSSSSPLGVTFSAAVVGGHVVLYYTSTGAASFMRYKTELWPM